MEHYTIDVSPLCHAVTDVVVSYITQTTATVTWTASATAVDGYIVDVYEAGADISVDATVFTEVVAAGVTSVEVTELAPETAYDVYVTSICGGGETATSNVVTFTTDPIVSVEDFDYVKLEVYPNPVDLDLYLTATKVIEEVHVYNILGQRVMTQKSNSSSLRLDVSRLATANYVLKVKVEGVLHTIKFVKK